MLLALKVMLWAVRSLALSRQALVLDNLALREQLAVAVRDGDRATTHRDQLAAHTLKPATVVALPGCA